MFPRLWARWVLPPRILSCRGAMNRKSLSDIQNTLGISTARDDGDSTAEPMALRGNCLRRALGRNLRHNRSREHQQKQWGTRDLIGRPKTSVIVGGCCEKGGKGCNPFSPTGCPISREAATAGAAAQVGAATTTRGTVTSAKVTRAAASEDAISGVVVSVSETNTNAAEATTVEKSDAVKIWYEAEESSPLHGTLPWKAGGKRNMKKKEYG